MKKLRYIFALFTVCMAFVVFSLNAEDRTNTIKNKDPVLSVLEKVPMVFDVTGQYTALNFNINEKVQRVKSLTPNKARNIAYKTVSFKQLARSPCGINGSNYMKMRSI